MPCELSEQKLLQYLFSLPDEADRTKVEAHLSACSACRETLDDLRGAAGLLKQWDTAAEGRELARRVLHAERSRVPTMFAWAACAASLAFAVLWILASRQRDDLQTRVQDLSRERDAAQRKLEQALALEELAKDQRPNRFPKEKPQSHEAMKSDASAAAALGDLDRMIRFDSDRQRREVVRAVSRFVARLPIEAMDTTDDTLSNRWEELRAALKPILSPAQFEAYLKWENTWKDWLDKR